MNDRALGELPGWSLAWSDEFDGAGNLAMTVRRPDPQLGARRFSGCRLYPHVHLIACNGSVLTA